MRGAHSRRIASPDGLVGLASLGRTTKVAGLTLSDDAFREAARAHPVVVRLRELRSALSEMRLADLAVGRDGRNRTMFPRSGHARAAISRATPSLYFGPSVWLRGLIQPPPGFGLAYIDWQQEEFGIAAALSGDPLMMEAYRSGDPYLAFAKQAGSGTSRCDQDDAQSHARPIQGQRCWRCNTGWANWRSPAHRATADSRARAVALHRETYRVFWRWSDAAVDYAMLNGQPAHGVRLAGAGAADIKPSLPI